VADATVTLRSAGTMSPPAKRPARPVIMVAGSTRTTPSSISRPATRSSSERSTSWPSASTTESAVSVSKMPVPHGLPFSSSSILSIVRVPSPTRLMVESHLTRTPSSSASSTSNSCAGMRSRVRR
jgi:hypothetical protein